MWAWAQGSTFPGGSLVTTYYSPEQSSRGHSAHFGIIKNFNRNQLYSASPPPQLMLAIVDAQNP